MKNDPTIVPAKILTASDLVVTITYNAAPDKHEPYRLTIVKNTGHEMGYWDFDSFEEMTQFLDGLCDDCATVRDREEEDNAE